MIGKQWQVKLLTVRNLTNKKKDIQLPGRAAEHPLKSDGINSG
jgi:hypothetical protein